VDSFSGALSVGLAPHLRVQEFLGPPSTQHVYNERPDQPVLLPHVRHRTVRLQDKSVATTGQLSSPSLMYLKLLSKRLNELSKLSPFPLCEVASGHSFLHPLRPFLFSPTNGSYADLGHQAMVRIILLSCR
jgi:hypothetical protein